MKLICKFCTPVCASFKCDCCCCFFVVVWILKKLMIYIFFVQFGWWNHLLFILLYDDYCMEFALSFSIYRSSVSPPASSSSSRKKHTIWIFHCVVKCMKWDSSAWFWWKSLWKCGWWVKNRTQLAFVNWLWCWSVLSLNKCSLRIQHFRLTLSHRVI